MFILITMKSKPGFCFILLVSIIVGSVENNNEFFIKKSEAKSFLSRVKRDLQDLFEECIETDGCDYEDVREQKIYHEDTVEFMVQAKCHQVCPASSICTKASNADHRHTNMLTVECKGETTMTKQPTTVSITITAYETTTIPFTAPNTKTSLDTQCLCPCNAVGNKWDFLKVANYTVEELKEILKEELLQIRSNLTVDIKTLTSSLRKRISANDVRTSSSTIGYFGFYHA